MMKHEFEKLNDQNKAEIEALISREDKSACIICDRRYAVKSLNGRYYVNNGSTGQLMAIEVTRHIIIYHGGITTVQDLIASAPMYAKEVVLKYGFLPVSEKDIAGYGSIVKYCITDENNDQREIVA